MVNDLTKGKLFAITCIVLIAFGCSSASNLIFGEVFIFEELIPTDNSKMTIIDANDFNPVYLVNHKVYIKNTVKSVTNKTNIVNKTKYISNETSIFKKYSNKTKYNTNTKIKSLNTSV